MKVGYERSRWPMHQTRPSSMRGSGGRDFLSEMVPKSIAKRPVSLVSEVGTDNESEGEMLRSVEYDNDFSCSLRLQKHHVRRTSLWVPKAKKVAVLTKDMRQIMWDDFASRTHVLRCMRRGRWDLVVR